MSPNRHCISKPIKFLYCVLLAIGLNTAFAADENDEMATSQLSVQEIERILDKKFASGEYSRKGADQCLRCHDNESDMSAMGIFDNLHGSRQVPGSPFQGLQCEACHGPAGDHIKSRIRDGEVREPMIPFGSHAPLSAEKQDSVCLSCHENDGRKHWQGSQHQASGVPCAGCHKVHTGHDEVLAKKTQARACSTCHVKQMSEMNLRSSHPLKWGQMACTDCHNPHGSLNAMALHQNTLNDNCYSCHAEKRGPLLWEHEPVTEDCSTCHNPHGSVNTALLNKRTPQLCQACHTAAGHPSVPFDGINAKNGTPSMFVVGEGCVNCHSQIHGSNHPSGSSLQR